MEPQDKRRGISWLTGLLSSFDSRPRVYLLGAAALVAGIAFLAESLGIMGHWAWALPVLFISIIGMEIALQRFPGQARGILAGTFCATVLMVIGAAYAPPNIEPLSNLDFAPVEAEVIPGGERIVIFPEDMHHFRSHVAFYTTCGQALITGHTSRGLRVGEEYSARVDGSDEAKQVRISVAGSYNVGQIIEGLPKPPARESIPLAAPSDVREANAVVVLFGEDTPVTIKGVVERRTQMIVAVFHEKRVERGHSGAPLIQDGHLVGILYSTPLIREDVGFFRPAAEAYAYLVSQGHIIEE